MYSAVVSSALSSSSSSSWFHQSSKAVLMFKPPRSLHLIRASSGFSVSLQTGFITEMDAVTRHSEIVPDTLSYDSIEMFPPAPVTVDSSLLLRLFDSHSDDELTRALNTALADSDCYKFDDSDAQISCFHNKALVNVGAEIAKLVPGCCVSTVIDICVSQDQHAIIRKGIEASRVLESEGIQTHMTCVFSFCQTARAADAGASVIEIFVGRLRDWARKNHGDPAIEAARRRGEDPGIALVTKAYNFIHKYGYKSKLMATDIRNKQDIFDILGVDYIITPLEVLKSLEDSITPSGEEYSLVRRLSPEFAAAYYFRQEEFSRHVSRKVKNY